MQVTMSGRTLTEFVYYASHNFRILIGQLKQKPPESYQNIVKKLAS